MTSGGANIVDATDVAQAHNPTIPASTSLGSAEKTQRYPLDDGFVDNSLISEDDLRTLRRVAGKIPWQAYTIAFVELCERFSYYGTTVVWSNYITQPLPEGSTTGANHGSEDFRSGAFGLGQKNSFAATTFNSFWAYFMPIIGAYIADEYLGRFKTIQYAIFISILGHVILVTSAVPSVIVHTKTAWGVFWLGMVIMGIGTGGFKSNISPLIAEQVSENKMEIVVLPKTGERVIYDPVVTIQRVYMYFYLMINVGSLVGQIAMVYAEQDVGFWLAFTLPTCMFCICPAVLFACRNKYKRTPPTGSVVPKALRLWALATKGRWSLNPATTVKNMRDMSFWENVKPSHLGANKPAWMNFDDAWVDEVRRGVKACSVFVWYPVYWLTYNQMTNNLTVQAGTMQTNGLPNDLIQNIDPLALIIFIPICDAIVYPWFRRIGFHFTALKRIFWGFMTGVMAMVIATIIQYYIYKEGPAECGKFMNTCPKTLKKLGIQKSPYAPINVWVQIPAYVLIAFSEIFASITGLEYAFTKAPKNMRSLVMSLFLFTNAISAALAQAFVALSDDPYLIWNYGSISIIAFVVGIIFWIAHRKLDKEEDHLNMLPAGHLAKNTSEDGSELEGQHLGYNSSPPLGHVEEKTPIVTGEPPAGHPAGDSTTIKPVVSK